MSNFPNLLDDDISLIRVDDNITELGSQAINELRSAVFAIEDSLGIGLWSDPSLPFYGTTGALAAFLKIAHNPDGSLNPSAFVSLPQLNNIVNAQISPTAAIAESKLALAYYTTDLFSFISQVNTSAQQSLNFITNYGSKIEPHIEGLNFFHTMNAILVSSTSSNYFYNDLGTFRDNSNLYNLFNDLNSDYIKHQVANNQPVTIVNGQQSNGTVPPTNYAHVSAGIYLNTTNFSFIPQTTTNLQSFAEFVDGSNLLLLGSRIQTLYQNGIPRTSVSSALGTPGVGQVIIPNTPAFTFLLDGYNTFPTDDINHGDDVVQFLPSAGSIANNSFDALFSAIKIGDILTVNYGSFSISNIIIETKYLVSADQSSKTYIVRIASKNLKYANVTATVTRSLYNNNKAGVLALAQVPSPVNGVLPSLIVGSPRSAEVLSVNFSPDLIDNSHYNLYLAVYPNGDPTNSIFNMPAIDISGNQGKYPGTYTLGIIVQNINNQFRAKGYNSRFIAFQYEGELGIKMSDSINNISFSILDGVLNPTTGIYNLSLSQSTYPNNAIGVPGFDLIDASGLGPLGAGVSGPPFATSFASSFAAQTPTKIIQPKTLKTFYVNGSEEERFSLQPLQSLDTYGDGYWPATILVKNIIAGVRVEVTYQVNLDLSTSGLAIGKTITAVPAPLIGSSATFVDAGRFFIEEVQFIDCASCPSTNANIIATNITVYDAIQSPTGVTPFTSAPIGTVINLYFSDDSVGFDAENVSDANNIAPFNRLMEIYIDANGNTFSNERARMYYGTNIVSPSVFGYSYTGEVIGNALTQVPLYGDASDTLNSLDIISVSSKLRGYSYGTVNKINLQLISYDSVTGNYDGYLCNFSFPTVSNMGPIISGKKGEITRFYDQTNVEYIDVILNINSLVSLVNSTFIDFQLFPTLDLDGDVMLLGTVQVNNLNNTLQSLTDRRQFGNISEVQLSTSALEFISSPAQNTMQNGVIRGFDLIGSSIITTTNQIMFTGGTSLTNGHFNNFNPITISVPLVRDYNGGIPIPGVLWAVCSNDQGDIQLIPLTDFNASVNAINNPGRLLTLFNVINNQNYRVDSNIFSNIINVRKDLTILWLINAQVISSTSYTFTLTDARKYVTESNGNNFAVLTSDGSQGNFKSFDAINSWINYNSLFQNTVILRGNFNFNSDPGFPSANYQGDGCTITINSSTSITLPNNCSFENCNFIIFAAQGFIIPGTASNISFSNCTFNYTPDFGFSAGNLINTGNAAIYSSVFALQNISVKDCIFTSGTADRPSFINFEFNSDQALAQSIYIQRNKFYSAPIDADEMLAVISFVSILIVAPSDPEGMKLIDCVIEDNVCDKDQMIAIAATPDDSGNFVINTAIVPVNVRITGNTCGTIGVLGMLDLDRDLTFNYHRGGFGLSKNFGATVDHNNCKLISTLNYLGQFTGSTEGSGIVTNNALNINSCPINVANNNCSWIQLATNMTSTDSFNYNALITVSDNMLRAFNSSYLNNFGTGLSNSAIVTTFVNAFNLGAPSTILINGNTTNTGKWLKDNSGGSNTYNYNSCLTSLTGNTTITNNIFNGINVNETMMTLSNSSDDGLGYFIVTNNQFYRNSVVITNYISITTSATPGGGIITNNFFDSNTIDDVSNTNLVLISPSALSQTGVIYTQNKNQTGYVSLDINQFSWYTSGINQAQIENFSNVNNGWPLAILSGAAVNKTVNSSLDSVIPIGAQLMYVLIGAEGLTIAGTDQMSFTILQGNGSGLTNGNIFTAGSFTGSLVDLVSNGGIFASGSNIYSGATSGHPTAIDISAVNTNYYAYLDLSSSKIIGGNGSIQMFLKVKVASGDSVLFSPVLLKYQW